MYLKAQAGAVIATYVYINDDDSETSLLGKDDAERLGIVKIFFFSSLFLFLGPIF